MKILSININGVATMGKQEWVRGLRKINKIDVLGIQETKAENLEMWRQKTIWGGNQMESAQLNAIGASGGIITLWNKTMFMKEDCIIRDGLIAVKGIWRSNGTKVGFINVYAPQDLANKRRLWGDIIAILNADSEVKWIVFGDFNEVRKADERKGTIFNFNNAKVFNEFIHLAGLIEVKYGGRRFSRYNKHGDKMSLIDRFFVNFSFTSSWPNPNVLIMPRGFSDHCPLLLNTEVQDFGPTYFKVFNTWMDNQSFKKMVKSTWKNMLNKQNVSPITMFMYKLRNIKKKTKEWREEYKEKTMGDKLRLDQMASDLDLLAETSMLNEVDKRKRIEVDIQRWEMAKKETANLKQKAKIKWAIEGDENTKYFHGIINSKAKTNFIHGITINGQWVNDPIRIKKEAVKYFSKKFDYASDDRPSLICNNFKKLNDQQKNLIESPFSMEEVKRAVWDCGDEKSPGPDGFSLRFYKIFWEVIKSDLMLAFKYFEDFGNFGSGNNASFLTLIPKSDSLLSYVDFRPICLISSLYKILAKVLASRLKGVIGDLIGIEQTGFLKERSILEGPMIISEVLSLVKKRKQKTFVLKVDFEKAFDTISWEFLDEVMTHMSFGSKWRNWISNCLASSTISILINGSPTTEFIPKRGVRQGDPLAPFLFLLAAEGLNSIMHNAIDLGIFHGIKISGNGPIISHLQYADDSIFVGEWSNRNISNLFRILRCLHLSSGLNINYNKSNLFGIGIDEASVYNMAQRFNCSVGAFPFKYLGLPIGASMNKCESWSTLIHRFHNRLSSWKANTLSIGGRLQLCKSVLGNLGIYFLSLFKAPTKILKELESIRSRFFWGGNSDNRKIHWVAWDKTLADHSVGGLGIGSLKALNNALLCKWWWRILREKNTLWGKVIEGIHGPNGGVGDRISKGKCAGVWRNILKVNSDLDKHNLAFSSLFMFDPNGGDLVNNNWSWRLSNNGRFSVASFRYIFDNLYLPSSSSSICNWIKTLPRKVNVHVWRVIQRRLPTLSNLEKRGITIVNNACYLCRGQVENEDHLFVECSIAKKIIENIGKWWNVRVNRMDNLDDLIKWPKEVGFKGNKETLFMGVLYSYLWLLWVYRNEVVFRNKDLINTEQITMQLIGLTFFWFKHRSNANISSLQWAEWCCNPWTL